jgi:hypothetical protein
MCFTRFLLPALVLNLLKDIFERIFYSKILIYFNFMAIMLIFIKKYKDALEDILQQVQDERGKYKNKHVIKNYFQKLNRT